MGGATVTQTAGVLVKSITMQHLTIAIIAIAVFYSNSNALLYRPTGLSRGNLPPSNPSHTIKDPNQIKVSIEGSLSSTTTTIHARSSHAFSETYYEARSKFRYVASKLLNEDIVQLHTFEVMPGWDYTIDIAVIKGDDDGGLVVHTSGCHGAEGYAGSAVQIAYLQHLLDTNNFDSTTTTNNTKETTTKPTIILVHALNPYGMAHNRRFNENNVDLNRNALTNNEWKEVLQRDINIASYDKFDKRIFNPPRAPTWYDPYFIFVKAIAANVMYGFVNMKRSIIAGQYHNPRGIFYGGKELEPSHVILRDFLVKNGYTEKKDGLVTWIDVHTGLGPCGVDTLLAGMSDTSVEEAFPGAPLQDLDGGKEGGDVSSGYDLSRGSIKSYYTQLFPSSTQPLVLGQEFGTRRYNLVQGGMILENMAFNFAPEDQPKWAEFSRDTFYVRTDEWRKNILVRGLTVLHQAIERSMGDANNKKQ